VKWVKKDSMISKAASFSLHDGSNDNGTSLADFAVTRNVVIGGMMFAHMNARKHGYLLMVSPAIRLPTQRLTCGTSRI
jgi:hypothetical protein